MDTSAPRRLRATPVQAYRVRITVPRLGSRRAWEATRGDFEQRLAALASPAVSGAEIESETRRGRDYVRVTFAAAVNAADVAEALTAAWDAFLQAAGDDAAGWDMAAASAEIRPGGAVKALPQLADPVDVGPPTDPDYLNQAILVVNAVNQAVLATDSSAMQSGEFPLKRCAHPVRICAQRAFNKVKGGPRYRYRKRFADGANTEDDISSSYGSSLG